MDPRLAQWALALKAQQDAQARATPSPFMLGGPVPIAPVQPEAPMPMSPAPLRLDDRIQQALEWAGHTQGQNEPNIVAALGQVIPRVLAYNRRPAAMTNSVDTAVRDNLAGIGRWALDTPAAKSARNVSPAAMSMPAAGHATDTSPLNSYKDPRWAGMEQDVERLAGIPTGSLALIRTRGERSNQDQVSSAGARSVYQITPTTAKLIEKKYGFDPMSSPSASAKGAALLLKEGIQRTGSLQGAVQQYHGGTDPSNYGPQNASYMQRVFGGVQDAGGLSVGFDPSMGQAALGQISEAEAAAMKPESFSYDVSGAPKAPDVPTVAPTDFSKVDAQLEKLRPHEISEKEQLQTRRDGWFQGLGQALANLPDGAGLGRVLAAVGGGALAGGAKGNAEVRAAQDAFDEKMVRFNNLVLQNEMAKATTVHQEAQHLADQQYARGLQQFKADSDRFFATNFGTVQGNTFITSKSGPDGKVSVTRTPIAGAVKSAFALQRAEIMSSMGSQYNSALGAATQMRNGAILQAAGQQASMSAASEDAGAGAVMGLATMARDIAATGRAQGLIGNDEAWTALNEEVSKSLQTMGVLPGSTGYDEQYQQVLAERLTAAGLSDPKFRQRMLDAGGAASAVMMAKRQRDGKVRVQQGPKGTTTTREY